MVDDPTTHGGEGQYGTTDIWNAITGTFTDLIHGTGDYLQEKFFGDRNRNNDEAYHRDWQGQAPTGQDLNGKGPSNYKGFQFDSITAMWVVGAVGAVAVLAYILKR